MTKFNEIKDLLKEELGEYFLSLLYFSNESKKVVYLDEEIENKYSKNEFVDKIKENFVNRICQYYDKGVLGLGSLNTTVLSFEDGILMMVELEENETLVVCLDKEASMLVTPCELLGKIKKALV